MRTRNGGSRCFRKRARRRGFISLIEDAVIALARFGRNNDDDVDHGNEDCDGGFHFAVSFRQLSALR